MNIRLFHIILWLLVCVSSQAVPAWPGGLMRTDAEGKQKMVFLHGNEFFHYLTDEDGTWLNEETLLPLSETEQSLRKQEGRKRERIRKAVQTTGVDRLLAPKGPVILVNFADSVLSHTKEQMIEWATDDNYVGDGATGSILRYFHDNSYGQYVPELDFYGPVTISRNMEYYGKNDSRGDDLRPDEMVVEACQLAHDEMGLDFSQYDYNGDGEVDWVVIIYAGYGEADSYITATIWPHQYELSATQKAISLDGKTINRYCCTNELSPSNSLTGIGIFVHEFSHILGLPDLYVTNNAPHKTSGLWDVMDMGVYNNDLYTPPMYSAYERWWLGWLEPTLLNSASSVTLNELGSSGAAAYITENGTPVTNILSPYSPNTFYVLENRQQEGWDAYIPGHGMLITKITYNAYNWASNIINNNASTMGIDIIEADGSAPSKAYEGGYGKPGDAFPAGSTSFTKVANYQITNIVENNGIITFDLNGGGSPTFLDIRDLHEEDLPTKVIRNGQVLILRGNHIYTILGNEL